MEGITPIVLKLAKKDRLKETAMKIGDEVRIVKCEACPKVVGKVAEIVEITTPSADIDEVQVKFGKGRPPLKRPSVFAFDDVVLVEKPQNNEALVDQENG